MNKFSGLGLAGLVFLGSCSINESEKDVDRNRVMVEDVIDNSFISGLSYQMYNERFLDWAEDVKRDFFEIKELRGHYDDWGGKGYAVKSELNGIRDLRKAARYDMFEDIYAFVPELKTWIELGFREDTHTVGMDYSLLEKIARDFKDVRVYHFHPKEDHILNNVVSNGDFNHLITLNNWLVRKGYNSISVGVVSHLSVYHADCISDVSDFEIASEITFLGKEYERILFSGIRRYDKRESHREEISDEEKIRIYGKVYPIETGNVRARFFEFGKE